MGGTGLYHPPVDAWTSISSWADHTNRSTPSTEPGVDWRCPIGTPVYAAASGIVYQTAYDLNFAGGRFVTIDLDDGRRVRYLHLSHIDVSTRQRVAWGERVGLSGASGYGVEDWSADPSTGGAHVHETIFPSHAYVFGRYATLDPWPLTDTSTETDIPTALKGTPMSALRVISGPYYRSAKQQVVHNGSVAKSIPNVVALALRQGGVESHDYDDEDGFNAELAEVWGLGNIDRDEMAREFGDRLAPKK